MKTLPLPHMWQVKNYTPYLLVFCYNMKDYCIQQAKLQLDANQPNSPPLFCLLVRYSAHILSHDVTLLNHILCIIEHLIVDLAEEPPPPSSQTGKNSEIGSIHFITISSNFGSAGRKVPPSPAKQRKVLRLDLSISCNSEQLWFARGLSPVTKDYLLGTVSPLVLIVAPCR